LQKQKTQSKQLTKARMLRQDHITTGTTAAAYVRKTEFYSIVNQIISSKSRSQLLKKKSSLPGHLVL